MSKCTYCHRPIRESIDPGVPFVHADSGNSFCDVTTPESAVRLAGSAGRNEAEPRCTFCGTVLVAEDCPRYGYGPEHAPITAAEV